MDKNSIVLRTSRISLLVALKRLAHTIVWLVAASTAWGQAQLAPKYSYQDYVNVPGAFATAQEVCDARRAWLDYNQGTPYAPATTYQQTQSHSWTTAQFENGACWDSLNQLWAAPYFMGQCPSGWDLVSNNGGPVNYYFNNAVVMYWGVPYFAHAGYPVCQRSATQPDLAKNAGACDGNCGVLKGNPVHTGTGNKYQREVDIVVDGALRLERSYNSLGDVQASQQYGYGGPQTGNFGNRWRSNFHRMLVIAEGTPTLSSVTAVRGDGKSVYFSRLSGQTAWTGELDVSDQLVELTAGGTRTGWKYIATRDDTIELYNANGALTEIDERNGFKIMLSYSDATTPPSIAPRAGLLIGATDSFGRSLSFVYNTKAQIASVTDPAGQPYQYAYDSNGDLTSVTYPDGKQRTYVYNEAQYTSNNNFPSFLTGIIDELGNRFATFKYNSARKAISTEHAGGVEHLSFTYSGSGSTDIVDALGATHTRSFQTINGTWKPVSVTQAAGAGSAAATQSTAYNSQGNAISRTDFNGVITTYSYDLSRNLETSRTEASGTPRARTITTSWHPTYRLPTQIDEPGKRTTFTHDANGNVLTQTVLDTTTSTSRTWTYTYTGVGQVLTVNGPRTDVSDITTYTYYTCTTGYECGQVHTITNALGQTTTYNTYNGHGQPLTITDANNVVTTLVYDNRQRLTSRTTSGEITSFEYWPTGLVKKVTLPDTSFVSYTYDAAHRLTQIDDSEGNKIVYTLDAMGNRTKEELFDPSNTLTNTRSQLFDTLSRLYQVIAAANTAAVTTTFGYDANGNPTTVNAPMSRNSTSQYDELNRLKQSTDPLSGNTLYGYNALDQLISVTDPRNLTTAYSYNALGDLTQQVSPDTGTTTNTYDSGGNLKTSTDARSKTATYSYDALNRVTQVQYSDQTIGFTYDTTTNGVGRLSSLTDASGSTGWTYTPQGRIGSKLQVMGSQSKSVAYSYNSSGQLTTITTPSNQTITYGYTNGRVTSIQVNGIPLLNTILYEPFGPISGWTWGNSTLAVRVFDTDGKVTHIDSAGLNTYGYDDAFRITGITDTTNSANSLTFNYDLLDRLTSGSKTGQSETFTYDANGNRQNQGGTTSSTFTNSNTSNRLNSVSGALTKNYVYDNAGNTTSDGSITYTYNDAGRMITATQGGVTTTYSYNALGQRVTKTTSSITTYFVYDEAGHLLGEYDQTGEIIQEIVWLGDTPVASIRFGSCGLAIFYIHTDHLNTPRKITKRSTNEVVWRWDSDAFGATAANENPSGLGTFAFNVRFPGMYQDQETGLYFNGARYYDPQTGRYPQSDPIGLAGGINTYTYVGGNPISFIDPFGLAEASPLPNPRPGFPGLTPEPPMRPFPSAPPANSPWFGAAAGFLARCAGVIGGVLFTDPNPGGQCSDFTPRPGKDEVCKNQNGGDCEKERQLLEQGRQALLNWKFTGLTLPERVQQAADYNEQVREFNLLVALHNQKCPAHRVEPLPTIPPSGKPG